MKKVILVTLSLCFVSLAFASDPSVFFIGNGNWPDIDGNIVVYSKYVSSDNYDIYAKDLASNVEFPICTNPKSQFSPEISGNIIVWIDARNAPPSDPSQYAIYAYDLNTHTEFPIRNQTGFKYDFVQIDGNIVVYCKQQSPRGPQDPLYGNVYGYNLTTQTEFLISNKSGGSLVTSISKSNVVYYNESCLYCYNISTMSEQIISTASGQPSVIDGDIIVHTTKATYANEVALRGYDLKTKQGFDIVPPGTAPGNPDISNGIIIWTASPNLDNDNNIYGYDIYTHNIFPICTAPTREQGLAISGETVVWSCWDDGKSYGTKLPLNIIRCTERPVMDFNYDCKVDFQDFIIFCQSWLECNLNPPSDCWK